MAERKRPRELLSLTIERVDAVTKPATGKRFAVIKDETAIVEVVRRVVAEHLERESLLAKLRREVTALGLSVQDLRAAAERRRRPDRPDDEAHGMTPGERRPPASPADPKHHVFDADGNPLRCTGGCHDYDAQSGRWMPRRPGEGRP